MNANQVLNLLVTVIFVAGNSYFVYRHAKRKQYGLASIHLVGGLASLIAFGVVQV